jgi:clan AA aspartic protease
MIGRMEVRQAMLPVTFRMPGRPDLSVEFVVDTGFTEFLTLPSAAVAALGLPFDYGFRASLADDSEAVVPVHAALIVWNGVQRAVPVLAMGRRPLLGTALLEGCELVAQFADNGLVTVDDI